MAPFGFKCPITGQQVQGWVADEDDDKNQYRAVTCLACHHIHRVNPKTGKVIGKTGERQDFPDFSALLH